MTWLRKIPWLPVQEKKTQAVMYNPLMLLQYFVVQGVLYLIFLIPAVSNFTGIRAWQFAILGATHFVSSILPQTLFKNLNNSRFMLWGLFSDRVLASALALFGADNAGFLWVFHFYMCVTEAVMVAPSVYSGFVAFIAPLFTWSIFLSLGWRAFSSHDLTVIITVSSISVLFWFLTTGTTREYRRIQREIEKSHAETELERSRTELSRDIHDAIAAIFTRILAVQKDEAGETAALTRDGLKQLRDIVTALQVENTSIGFLSSWLNHYSQQYFENTEIRADFTVECDSADATLEPVHIIHVMRIYQELCQNALKHAGATSVATLFRARQNQITLEFSDNGKGFRPSANETQGLKNMDERASELGGQISRSENPQGGSVTRIAFAV